MPACFFWRFRHFLYSNGLANSISFECCVLYPVRLRWRCFNPNSKLMIKVQVYLTVWCLKTKYFIVPAHALIFCACVTESLRNLSPDFLLSLETPLLDASAIMLNKCLSFHYWHTFLYFICSKRATILFFFRLPYNYILEVLIFHHR